MHTPGPWEVRLDGDEWCIDAPRGDPTIGHSWWGGLAVAYGCDDFRREGAVVAEANARLIAAAPDMLQALRAAKLVIRNEVADIEDCGAYQAVVAAMLKATGEQP